MADCPVRYDVTEETFVPVTQDWVDLAMQRMAQMASERVAANASGSDRAPGNAQIAVAYAVTVDGFISIAHRAIRNPKSPFLVWMSKATWTRLAVCATTQGQFYIPCTPTLNDVSVLRALAEAP